MKIAVLGTGMVGSAIGTKLVELGHEVIMGSRTVDNEKGRAWLERVSSERASLGTFNDAAHRCEVLFNCTSGSASLDALALAGEGNMNGKVLLDLSNPLDFSRGMPPRLFVCNDDSLGEQIQKAFPKVHVVKTLNTVSNSVMVNPGKISESHTVFLAGNDAGAKTFVDKTVLREWFGWSRVLDLGDISASRGLEMYLPLWLKVWGALGTTEFNLGYFKEG